MNSSHPRLLPHFAAFFLSAAVLAAQDTSTSQPTSSAQPAAAQHSVPVGQSVSAPRTSAGSPPSTADLPASGQQSGAGTPASSTASSIASSTALSAPVATGEAPVKILHAYANLVQIPVLVLDRDRQPLLRLDPGRFTLRLDAGPGFAPRHVRTEGSDPLRLTILIDERAGTAHAEPEFWQAIPRLAPGLLSREDSVNIAVIRNCLLEQTSTFVATPAHLASAVTALQQRGSSGSGSCRDRNRLWDSTFDLLQKMGDAPGRRVLMLLTDGEDNGSKLDTRRLVKMAGDQSAAIFAIRERPPQNDPRSGRAGLAAYSQAQRPDMLAFVAESAGGMVLEGTNHTAQQMLERVLMLVRGRYVLDFVRPSILASGTHILDVSIGDPNAFLRAAGVGMPVADPNLLSDPNRVPSDPAREPQTGGRRN